MHRLWPPPPFLNPPHSQAHKGPGSQVRTCQTGIPAVALFLVCPFSRLPSAPTSCLQYKATPWWECTKAQSHTPSSSYSSPEKGPELRPRPDMPPCSFPGACFPNPLEDNRAEDRRHHHSLSPFCSGAPSCCHIHRALGLACPCCTPTLGAVDTRANPSVAYSQT